MSTNNSYIVHRAVLSINQPYELTTRTVGGLPVQAEEWEVSGHGYPQQKGDL